MSQKKGFSYYIRLDKRTFQGQLIRLYLIVALIVMAIFLFFRHSFLSYHERQEYISQTLIPTASSLRIISDIFEISEQPAKETDRSKVNTHLSALNRLSEHWKKENTTLYYQQILDEIESVYKKAAQEKYWKKGEEYLQLQKSLKRMHDSILAENELVHEEVSSTVSNLSLYFSISFLIFFFAGITISHISIKQILVKVKSFRNLMADISMGNLPESFDQTPDEFASTRKEVNSLTVKLKALTHFAKEVGQGNFDAAIEVFDKDSTLGKSLSEMRDSLKKVSEEEIARSWFNEGIAKFSELLRRNNQDIDSLTSEVISPLVKYLGAVQGAIFTVEKERDTHTPFLKMRSCYAYDRLKYIDKKIHAGSGLIGQAFLEKEKIHLTEIPADYESVTTGLGNGKPNSIIIIPLLENDNIEGVLEIASMKEFKAHHIEFLEKISETIAISINNVKNNEKTRLLLEEAQSATEQLRAQEEEMRQNMEELQATQEDMARARQEMEMKEFSQQAFIQHSPDALVSISEDYKIVFYNKAFNALSVSSPARKVQEGDDIFPFIGGSAKEWKKYFKKAFNGEQLALSTTDIEGLHDPMKEYLLFPVASKSHKTVQVSIIIRDLCKLQDSLNKISNRNN